VFKNRIKGLTEYTKIPKTKPQKIMQEILKTKKVNINILKREFDKTKHTYKYYKGNPNQLEKIDMIYLVLMGVFPERI
jgi:hypothetical protein